MSSEHAIREALRSLAAAYVELDAIKRLVGENEVALRQVQVLRARLEIVGSCVKSLGVPASAVSGQWLSFRAGERGRCLYTFETDGHIPWTRVLIAGDQS